jgi:ketosteroid isomerase-like protein
MLAFGVGREGHGRRGAVMGSPDHVASTRDQLDSMNMAFAEALAQGDLERLGGFYTEDAVFLRNGVPTLAGRERILELFRGPAGTGVVSFETGEVLEDGDIVVDIGTLLRDGEANGRYVVVYRRQADGTLKLAVDVPIGNA